MNAETDLMKLYSGRILALASDIPRAERLTNPGASAKRRSPLCGSTVTVDVTLTDGVISDFGQEVKACALGQAAASVVGANAIGASPDQITRARDELAAMLGENGPAPSAPFDELAVLQPASAFKNRHASILLTLDAIGDALKGSRRTAEKTTGV